MALLHIPKSPLLNSLFVVLQRFHTAPYELQAALLLFHVLGCDPQQQVNLFLGLCAFDLPLILSPS